MSVNNKSPKHSKVDFYPSNSFVKKFELIDGFIITLLFKSFACYKQVFLDVTFLYFSRLKQIKYVKLNNLD